MVDKHITFPTKISIINGISGHTVLSSSWVTRHYRCLLLHEFKKCDLTCAPSDNVDTFKKMQFTYTWSTTWDQLSASADVNLLLVQ
jgi:hypothetical protein